MSLEFIPFVLGPLANNTYLIFDETTNKAAIIDPAFDSAQVVDVIRERGLQLSQIWITHAHFDHIAGVPEVQAAWGKKVPVALHPDDLSLWQNKGDSHNFGFSIDPGPLPSMLLRDHQTLALGESQLEVRLVPGHSLGHVMYYCKSAGALFGGDVIFQGSVGRTDLPGGDFDLLIKGIRREVLSLPDATKIYPGHGPATTIGEERRFNPFLEIQE